MKSIKVEYIMGDRLRAAAESSDPAQSPGEVLEKAEIRADDTAPQPSAAERASERPAAQSVVRAAASASGSTATAGSSGSAAGGSDGAGLTPAQLKELGKEQLEQLKENQALTLLQQREGFAREREEAERQFRERIERIRSEAKAVRRLCRTLQEAGATFFPPTGPALPADLLRAAGVETLVPEGVAFPPMDRITADEIGSILTARAKYRAAIADIDARENAAVEAQLNELLEKYRDYTDRRRAIEESFRSDLAALEGMRTDGNTATTDRLQAEIEARRAAALREADSQEAARLRASDAMLPGLFSEAADLSAGRLWNLLERARSLEDYIRSTPAGEIATREGIPAERLRALKGAPEELKKFSEAIAALENELGGRGSGLKFFDDIRAGIRDIGRGGPDAGKGLQSIGAAVKGAMPAVEQFGKDLSSIFGESALGEDIGILSTMLAGLGSALGGVGRIASGDILGGITSLVSGIASVFSMASAASDRHREALRAVAQAQVDFDRKLTLSRLRQKRLFEEGTNVFGKREIAGAIAAVEAYGEAIAAYKKELAGDPPEMTWAERLTGDVAGTYAERVKLYERGLGALNDAKIVTGHKKTGLFGWGKGRDVYDNLLDVYPELIDANGRLDTQMLQVILDTQKMDEATRSLLESLIELSDEAEAAETALESYLSETFGSLGQGLTDAVVAAVEQGSDAMENFAKSVGDVLEKLGRQIVYSLFFADQFDELQKKLKAVYKSGKSEEEIAAEVEMLLADFFNAVSDSADKAQHWIQGWRETAARHGFDIFSGDSAAQSGRQAAFQTLTQEQGTKLEGMMTVLQVHAASVDYKMDSVTESLGGALDALSRISLHTSYLPRIYSHLAFMRREGMKIK